MQKVLLLLFAAWLLFACQQKEDKSDYDPAHDYFSFANSRQFLTRHLELDLTVDFEQQVLSGHAIHHMQQLDPEATTIVLDSRGLQIHEIQLELPGTEAINLKFEPGANDPVRGEPLKISLPENFAAMDEFLLKINYQTGPDASALMWLPPEHTAGGQHPFMFTQSQSIHARSWVPLQDSPSVRFTFDATIHTPPGLLALMSADNDPLTPRSGEYRFSMPQAIPSYLLALAVGNVFFESFGPETGVYAEAEVLQAAAYEVADTQARLDAAVEIYGPYLWGRYDLLILPPSFPYGGMENPRLSFITPSVLAGDRSLVSLIAHELAHSWSGNLVSNATWRDIWLNEGTTSYLEARLMEVLYGQERADEERVLTYQSMREALATVPPDMQALAPVFTEGDPDIGQDGLEYSKGQLLLQHLEALFGREVFDTYMAGYFSYFEFQAIGSEQWLDYIDRNLLQKHPGTFSRAQLEEWLYQPGIPADATVPVSGNLEQADAMARSWSSGELVVADLPHTDWSPQATVYFINALPTELNEAQLSELDAALGLSSSSNAEIARAWFIQVAERQHQPAFSQMKSYLGRYGRTRLVQPVYERLVANGEDQELAQAIFDKVSAGYHPITRAAIEPALTLSNIACASSWSSPFATSLSYTGCTRRVRP